MVGSGIDREKGLGFGVCKPVETQFKGRNVKVLAPEAAGQEVSAVFATLRGRGGPLERRVL